MSVSTRVAHALRKRETREVYDVSAPGFLEVWGPHQHDGYYVTGHESRLEAQEKLVAAVADRAGILPGARVLDVGSGLGGPAVWLARERACRVTGITNSEVQARLARDVAHGRRVTGCARFVVADAERLAFREGSFDAVLLLGALDHLSGQRACLAAARRLLAPGGVVAIADFVLAEGRDPAALAALRQDMGMEEVRTGEGLGRLLASAGYDAVRVSDETRFIAPSFAPPGLGSALRKLATPALWRLAGTLGARVFPLARAFVRMKRALDAGDLGYTFAVART